MHKVHELQKVFRYQENRKDMVPEGFRVDPCPKHPNTCWLLSCETNPAMAEHHVRKEDAVRSAISHGSRRLTVIDPGTSAQPNPEA